MSTDSVASAVAAADTVVPEARVVRGRVVNPAGTQERPVPGAWVVLHRVGPDRAAPLDSTQSGVDGRYEFRYRTSGSADALYFVSAMHAGIAYFSVPLREREVGGGAADIVVFDTSSVARALGIQGRHVIVGAPGPNGDREVVEVFELSNDTSVTLVARDSVRPIWSVALPDDATGFAVGQGDVGRDALILRDGRALLFAPFAPGVKQLSFSYRLGGGAFPLAVPATAVTSVFEVLVEEPGASASGPGLQEQDPVAVSGRNFRRFLAQDVPANGVVRIAVPRATASRRQFVFAAVGIALGAAMLVALIRAMARRPHRRAQPEAPLESERILAEITALDDRFARVAPDDPSRAGYDAERETLKARLRDALAAERRRT